LGVAITILVVVGRVFFTNTLDRLGSGSVVITWENEMTDSANDTAKPRQKLLIIILIIEK
jgi:ABC-type sulfate transport system substrate-binding protein